MAGILQLRRGLKSTYISEGTNLAEAFFVTTAEAGSISANNLIIGISGSVGDDVITLAKLSLANKDNSYADYNSGSFWITGDYTGSNMYLSGDITASNAWFKNDVRIDGHLIMGDNQPDDVVTIKSDFSGSLIPDNDNFGTRTPLATDGFHDIGQDNKRWRNIYLTRDSAGAGFLSGSHIDLTGNIKVDNEGRFGTLRVDDLTDNRILLVGPSGEVEDDENLTFDGIDFRLTGDYYQEGAYQLTGSGDISGSWTITDLAVDNGIVFTNAEGTLDNQPTFTWDGGEVNISGGVSASEDISVDREAYLASATIKDLTEDRIVIAGVNGEVEDDQYFRYTGNDFIIGAAEHFKVNRLSGNTFISGAVQLFSTLNVDGQSTLNSLNVEDLTDNRVVIVGAGGEIEDDGNFTFDGTELNIGTGNFTVQQGSGNTQILGTLDVDSQSTLSSLNVEDLTDNRIVIVGTSGEIEDDANLTFNGTELNIGTGNFTVQHGSGNTQIVGTLDVDSQSTLSSLNVEDLTSGRVVLAGTSGEIEDSSNLTFDGTDLVVTGNITVTQNLTVQGDTTQLDVTNLNVEDKNILLASGAVDAAAANGGGITIDGADATILYSSTNDSFQLNKQLQVEGNISGSSFGGTTLLSSSNENFTTYSQSVDSRLDEIEGPMSTSLDSRLIEIFSTGSDHESRIDVIETTFATTSSNTFNGDQTISGSLILSGSATFTGSVDITGDYQINGTSYSSSLFESASISGSVIEFTKGDDTTQQVQIPSGLGYSGLGWARYDDTTYTTASAFTITDGNTDVLPCNASSSIETHMHSTVSFYTGSGQKVQVENDGDVYSVTVTFNMRAGSNPTDGDFVRLKLQSTAGTPYDRVSKDLFFVKNNTSWHAFHEIFQYYGDTDFVTNGNQFKLTANGVDIDIADVIIFIQRTQNHSQH